MIRLFIIMIYIVILSCDKKMNPDPEFDCERENYFSRFEKYIPDYDTLNTYFLQNILRIRYDRTFSRLVGKDCFPNRPDVRCVSGDFYMYNLINDTVLIWLSYTQSNGLGKLDQYTVLPLDSIVLINDPYICDKNSPGFRFFY